MKKSTRTTITTCLILWGMVAFCLVQPVLATLDQDTLSTRRLRAGLDLFPSFLAADKHITDKKDRDGNLILYIVHHNDKRTAQKVANQLRDIKTIKGTPLKVVIVRDDYSDFQKHRPAGIFIAEPHLPHLSAIVHYGIQKSIITFSPFVGDVAQGVTGSIAVTARILPQVNTVTLDESNIDLKAFFMRIASRYPEVEIN